MEESTHIRVKLSTKRELEKLGKFGETYDDVIRRLIKKYKEDCKD